MCNVESFFTLTQKIECQSWQILSSSIDKINGHLELYIYRPHISILISYIETQVSLRKRDEEVEYDSYIASSIAPDYGASAWF